jgi:hypothetical protein
MDILCELRVEALLTKEDTEEILAREKIFAAHEEVNCLCYRAHGAEASTMNAGSDYVEQLSTFRVHLGFRRSALSSG